MCDFCFNNEYEKFSTYKDFDKFELLLNEKLKEKTLITFDTRNNSKSASDYLYKCIKCDVLWCLSIPDNAWRGYLLKRSHANKFLKKIKNKQEKEKKGCLIILFVIIITILIFTFK